MNAARGQRAWLYLLVACALGTLITGCGGGGSGNPPPPAPLSITTSSLPDGTTGQTYNQFLQATGGTGSLTWSITVGSLPGGLSLAGPTGVISGRPTTTTLATFNFTVQVQDSANPPRTVTQLLSIRVAPPVGFLTTSLPDGTTGLNYLSNLPITGGGPGPFTISVSSGTLPTGLTLSTGGSITGTPTSAGMFSFTAQVQDSATPPRTATRPFLIRVSDTLAITTTALSPATVNNPSYNASLSATGGTRPFTWAQPMESGPLPTGLSLSSTGVISGTPSALGTFNFTVQVQDNSTPQRSAQKILSIRIAPDTGAGSLGRNDFIPNATPLSNGTYQASISPLVDPPGATIANSDIDVYRLTANAGAIVTVEITADRLNPRSPLDSVIEIVDVNNTRLTTCRSAGSTTGLFNEPCMNDDIDSRTTDSRLEFQVSAGSPMTFYVRVLDFRGDARPDFIYTITISGAN